MNLKPALKKGAFKRVSKKVMGLKPGWLQRIAEFLQL